MIRDPKKFKKYIMKFGNYKGTSLHTLPSSYLWWLATETGNYLVNDQLSTLADEEWQWREKWSKHIGVPKHDRYFRGY